MWPRVLCLCVKVLCCMCLGMVTAMLKVWELKRKKKDKPFPILATSYCVEAGLTLLSPGHTLSPRRAGQSEFQVSPEHRWWQLQRFLWFICTVRWEAQWLNRGLRVAHGLFWVARYTVFPENWTVIEQERTWPSGNAPVDSDRREGSFTWVWVKVPGPPPRNRVPWRGMGVDGLNQPRSEWPSRMATQNSRRQGTLWAAPITACPGKCQNTVLMRLHYNQRVLVLLFFQLPSVQYVSKCQDLLGCISSFSFCLFSVCFFETKDLQFISGGWNGGIPHENQNCSSDSIAKPSE